MGLVLLRPAWLLAGGQLGVRDVSRRGAVKGVDVSEAVRCGSVIAALVCLAVLPCVADETVADGSMPEPAGEKDVVITGKVPPVEQGVKSIFTALPERNLLTWPLTESPGLDTATTVVGSEEIRWLDAFSIVDAMKYTPGAWTENRGRKVKSFFSVRGQRYPYPGYLVDGAWFREFHETNYFLSAANVDRIELLRSSASLMLSPGGMTGLVNIIPRTYDRRETRIDTYFDTESIIRTQISHGDRVGNTSYAVAGGFRTTDGPGGENAGENITNLFGRIVTSPIQHWTFSFTAMSFFGDRELQLAEPPASGTLQTRRDSYDPMHTYVFIGKARYEPNDDAVTEIVTNYASRRFHGRRIGSDDWLEEDYEFGARIMQSLKLGEDNTLRFGGMANRWVSPTGKRFYVGRRCEIDTYAIVVDDEHRFGRLLVNGGYRLSRTYFRDFGGFSVEGSPAGLASVRVDGEWEDPLHTISLGGAYKLTDTYSLHGNATWGQVAATPGMMDASLDRPDNEMRTKLDLGLKGQWDGFGEASVTGFFVHQDSAAMTSASRVVVNGEDFALFENADRTNAGIEFDTRTKRFGNGLQLFLNAAAMKTQRERGGRWERDKEIPRYVMGGGASWLVRDVELSVVAKNVSGYENDRFLPGGSEPSSLGAFTEVNTKVTYYFGADKEHSAFIGVDNLCDRHYSTVTGWPDEGIRVKGGFSLRF